MNKKRIIKSIILPDEVGGNGKWYPNNEDRYSCYDCGSLLFYLHKIMAVVQEDSIFQIVGHKDKTHYSLREAGFNIFCAECGTSRDMHWYDKDNMVVEFDDLDYADVEEVEYCLAQYNQNKTYTPRYKTNTVKILKEKLEEYEKEKKLKEKK